MLGCRGNKQCWLSITYTVWFLVKKREKHKTYYRSFATKRTALSCGTQTNIWIKKRTNIFQKTLGTLTFKRRKCKPYKVSDVTSEFYVISTIVTSIIKSFSIPLFHWLHLVFHWPNILTPLQKVGHVLSMIPYYHCLFSSDLMRTRDTGIHRQRLSIYLPDH